MRAGTRKDFETRRELRKGTEGHTHSSQQKKRTRSSQQVEAERGRCTQSHRGWRRPSVCQLGHCCWPWKPSFQEWRRQKLTALVSGLNGSVGAAGQPWHSYLKKSFPCQDPRVSLWHHKSDLKKKNQTTERLLLIWVPWALRNAFLLRLLLLPLSLTNVWLTPSSSCGRELELKCL